MQLHKRSTGLLAHISSLPSAYGIGDFGPSAYKFAGFLNSAGCDYWQVLPLNPTRTGTGNSPYSSNSAFAINPLFISPELLKEQQLIHDLHNPGFEENRVDYPKVTEFKMSLLQEAFHNFFRHHNQEPYKQFCKKNHYWLHDYSLFTILDEHHENKEWCEWEHAFAHHNEQALYEFADQHREEIRFVKFVQYIAFQQWFDLKNHCRQNQIKLFGDIPIYVHYHSADVWANQHFFKLDEQSRKPVYIAGVPPDYFSETGQLWGNPVYDWETLRNDGYSWWLNRLQMNFDLFDLVRIDHFRGLIGFWQVPADHENAINGEWTPVPYDDFFKTCYRKFPLFPVIAEDLGIITPDVNEFLLRSGIPGMRVLQFGLPDTDPENSYLPHNYIENCVAYTGTHDNNTLKGWYENELSPEAKQQINEYLGLETGNNNAENQIIRLLISSVARLVILPVQDILGLGQECRMNKPSTTEHNWEWRFSTHQLNREISGKMHRLNEVYGRI